MLNPGFRWRLAMLLTAIAVSVSAQAQTQSFPNKPVKWIVGYPPGGGSDFLARTVAAQMSIQMGQQVIIENRAGAGAIIGADIAAKSPGDGYTLFTGDNGVLIYNPALYKKLPYDPVRDFAPIGLMARIPLMVVAASNAGIGNAQELLDRLKKYPGQLSYGSAGNGSPHHLAMELFKSKTGLFLLHIPYRGAAAALQDAMGGQIPLAITDASSSMSFIKSGKLVPLAVFSATRIPQLPTVPTMIELGYKDVEAYAWQGMLVPASTPIDIRQKLSREMQAAVNNRDVHKKLLESSWEPVPSEAGLMAAYIGSETKKWHTLIRERGITLEQ